MSKRSPSLYLLDILITHNKITRYIEKFTNSEDILEAIELSKEEHKGNLHILNLLNTLQQEYM